jgi:outer membrane receptor protein involved in Fe transport
MLKILIRLIALLCSMIVASQTTTVKGTIMNQNNKPVELVEVILINKDSIALKSEFTNSNGIFEMQAEKGEYVLQARENGKIVYKQTINLMDNLDLGNIKIIENKKQLDEVVVTSRKKLIERKVDRLVFNVENSISATGGDAIDALKVTPGLRVQNDAISMIGKSGMKVMVDEKIIQLSGDDLVNFLKTISSNNIKSIEVITTPPSRYDAEGNSGLVNIKLKKAKSNSWNATVRGSARQATYLSGSTGLNFSYQKNKLELLLDLSAQKGKSIYINDINYEYPTEQWKNKIKNTTFSNTMSPLLNIGYKITSKTKIGLQYLGNLNRPKINENSVFNIYDNQTSFLNSRLVSNGNTNKNYNNHSVNLNSITQLDTLGRKISVDVDYFTYNSEKQNSFNSETNNYLLLKNNTGYTDNSNNQLITNFSSKVDFEMPYKWVNMSFGAKISTTNSNNDVKTAFFDTTDGAFSLNSNQSNIFNYKENVQALYMSSNKQINQKWEANAGLRVEFTQTKGFSQTINETNKTSYFKFFPTIYLSYKPSEKNTYNINFSRRIQRPSYSELNPARWYLNSNSYEVGNPFLQPSFSTNIELSHSYKGLFTTTLMYSKIADGYGQIVVHDIANNFQMFIRQNYFDAAYYGFQEYVSFSAFKNCSTTLSADVTYNESKTYTEYLLPSYLGWGATFSITNTVILNKSKTLTADISYVYNTASKWTESTATAYSNMSLALKYALLKKKLQLGLFGNDIFNTETYTFMARTGNVYGSYRQFYDSPFVRFSISCKLGNSIKNLERKAVGNQEEKDRVKS